MFSYRNPKLKYLCLQAEYGVNLHNVCACV